MSRPYLSAINAQGRRIPINQISDNFQWQKDSHSLQLGGFFKYITSFDHTTLDYNDASPSVSVAVHRPHPPACVLRISIVVSTAQERTGTTPLQPR